MPHRFAGTLCQPAVRVEIESLDDVTSPLPKRARRFLPPGAPVPSRGDILYLTSTSAWRVHQVIHEWLGPSLLHVHLVCAHEGGTHYGDRANFSLTV